MPDNTDGSCRHLVANGQRKMFALFESPPKPTPLPNAADTYRKPRFKEQDASHVMIGNVSVREHLKRHKIKIPFVIKGILKQVDWQPFESRYSHNGQRAYSPRLMVGLILYGLIEGKSSLRELEQLAVKDCGCWYVCGGYQPDHSIIGRFIQMHSETLSEDFFVELTSKILQHSQSSVDQVAVDGTVIQAAGSRYQCLKKEALAKRKQYLEEQRKQTPDDAKVHRKLQECEAAENMLDKRREQRRAKGEDADQAKVNVKEPEAVYQKQKRGGFEASYKPTIMTNKDRLIVGQSVDPSNENACIDALLEQAGKQGHIDTALCDAGFFTAEVLKQLNDAQINAYIPQGNSIGHSDTQNTGKQAKVYLKKSHKQIHKSHFTYDAGNDCYHCPQGHPLPLIKAATLDKKSQQYVKLYRCSACSQCPLQSKCTKSAQGRTIKRYQSDELKEAMTAKMQLEQNQQLYRKRSAWVEPVFSFMRHQMKFHRFKRKGLQKVRLEFSLQAMAYNITRAAVLCPLFFVRKIMIKMRSYWLRWSCDALKPQLGSFSNLAYQ